MFHAYNTRRAKIHSMEVGGSRSASVRFASLPSGLDVVNPW